MIRDGRSATEGGERRQAEIDRLAEWIESKGLGIPAILLLEYSKPLAIIGSQILFLLQPLFLCLSPSRGLFDDPTLTQYAALLEDPASVECLLKQLAHLHESKVAAGASGPSVPDELRLHSTRLE